MDDRGYQDRMEAHVVAAHLAHLSSMNPAQREALQEVVRCERADAVELASSRLSMGATVPVVACGVAAWVWLVWGLAIESGIPIGAIGALAATASAAAVGIGFVTAFASMLVRECAKWMMRGE